MPVRFAILLATCLLALALPAAAFGQGAGDDQYSDPFGNEQTDGGGDSGSQGGDDGGGGSSGGDTPTSSDDTGSSDTGTTGGGTGSSGVAGSSPGSAGAAEGSSGDAGSAGELPYTGAEGGLIALAGALLLAGGVALRLRLRDER